MLVLIGHSLTGSPRIDETHIMPQRYLVKVCMVQTYSTSNKHLHPKIADYILASTWLSCSLLELIARYLVDLLPGTVCITHWETYKDDELRDTKHTKHVASNDTPFPLTHTCLYICTPIPQISQRLPA